MDADYSVELGSSAAALEIPWQDPEGRVHYIDLRAGADSMGRNIEHSPEHDPERNIERNTERIPEARQFPALRRFLVDLNSPTSAWQTAKCDVWTGETEAENLYDAGFEQSCYIDIVLAQQATTLRGSLELHQRLAQELAQSLEENEELEATAEIVVRRCYFHLCTEDAVLGESEAGYSLTLFLTGYGASPNEAANCWAQAMEYAAGCWRALRPD
jgi:hypothetical protein